MPQDSRTTISIWEETRDEVRSLKRGGESYDELLQRLVEQANEASA